MTHTWIKAFGAAALVAGLYALPASAAMPSDWDANADAGLTNEEFANRFKTMGVFAKWDTDKNAMISQAEFTAGMTAHGEAFKTRFVGTENSDLYATWNKDGAEGLTEKEFYDAIYGAYDDNRDNTIQDAEFGDINTDIGTSGVWGGKS